MIWAISWGILFVNPIMKELRIKVRLSKPSLNYHMVAEKSWNHSLINLAIMKNETSKKLLPTNESLSYNKIQITMIRIFLLLLIGFFNLSAVQAQSNVFAFFEYDINKRSTNQFINGYAKDLEWHQSQNDDWSWIGWFVINGERRGRFIDTTPDH